MTLNPSAPDAASPTDLTEVFDHGPSPVDGGADFACSWSGPEGGQIIVRGTVLHINAGEQSAAIPVERLQGWSSRPHGDHVELSIESNDVLQVRIPAGLFQSVERALQGLR